MKTLLKYWPVVVFVLSLFGAGVVYSVWFVIVVDRHLLNDARRDERLGELEQRWRDLARVFVSEHPEYSPAIYYPMK